MLKKLLVLAITSGVAAKLYKAYVNKQGAKTPVAGGSSSPVPRRRPTSTSS